MAKYLIESAAVTITDITDFKVQGFSDFSNRISARPFSVLELPNTPQVKLSEERGQIKALVDGGFMKILEPALISIHIVSPNGTDYNIIVDNSGNLNTELREES